MEGCRIFCGGGEFRVFNRAPGVLSVAGICGVLVCGVGFLQGTWGNDGGAIGGRGIIVGLRDFLIGVVRYGLARL